MTAFGQALPELGGSSFAMSQHVPTIRKRTLSRPRDLAMPAARMVLVRYSRFVGLMKMALPAIAAALLGLIVVWPKVAPRDEAFQIAFANFNIKAVDTLSMTKPRYFGTDDKNLPFTVTADIATQVDPQTQVVALGKSGRRLEPQGRRRHGAQFRCRILPAKGRNAGPDGPC